MVLPAGYIENHDLGQKRARLKSFILICLSAIVFFRISSCFCGGADAPARNSPHAQNYGRERLTAMHPIRNSGKTASNAVANLQSGDKRKIQIPVSAKWDVYKVPRNTAPSLTTDTLFADLDAMCTISPRVLRSPIGNSRYAKTLRGLLLQSMRDQRNVLVFGEDGLRKDDFGCLIHVGSAGRMKQQGVQVGPLLVMDCEGISKDGRRIFGAKGFPGLLDRASQGTLLLNNAHALNKQLWPELGRLLENGTYTSRADGNAKQSCLRIIAVCERVMEELGHLSKESVATVKIPALRVRRQDLRTLVSSMLRRRCKLKEISVPEVEDSTYRTLEAYDFPGNIRELERFVERALLEMPEGSKSLLPEQFWPAKSSSKLDMFKVDLLEVYPGLRTFLQSDFFPEQLNHNFTKYVYAVFVLLLFVGPQTRDANFGLNLFWAWWWPGILVTYPLIGRLWCSVCPFMIYGEVVQRWRLAQGALLMKWPTEMMDMWGGWFLFALFAAILVWEECWVLENTAYLSSCLLLLITFGAMVGSFFFERRIWCRYLCPIGGMNGLFAKLSLTELRARRGTCSAECTTYHCYKGGPAEGEGQETDGCPLYSHPASLKDNRNCVLCMTCLKACPHRSVQLNLRAPGVDFGYPFLFPVPGTSSAVEHEASAHEVALLFLLLGAVYCHHISGFLKQLGWQEVAITSAMADLSTHIFLACLSLALPGLLVWFSDFVVRQAARTFAPHEAAPRAFIELAYCYLPLVWLASLAHYLFLGLTEAGRILPVAARTLGCMLPGLPDSSLRSIEDALPTLTAPPDVVAFLQGVTLLLGAGFSILLLQKLASRSSIKSLHQLLICILTLELWQLIV